MLKYINWPVSKCMLAVQPWESVEMKAEVFDNFVCLVEWYGECPVSGVLTFQEQADPGIVKLTDYRMHLTFNI